MAWRPDAAGRARRALGPQSNAVDADAVMWAFFEAHPLDVVAAVAPGAGAPRYPRPSMGVSRSGLRLRVLGLAVVAGLLAAVAFGALPGHLAGSVRDGLLFLGPALVLAMALFARRYPGERAIERWRARRAPRARLAALVVRPRPRPRALRGGGCLISASLAGRAPPLAAGC